MKAAEMRNQSIEELKKTLSALWRKQFTLRLVKARGELVKTHEIKTTRHDIARAKMVLVEKEGKKT